MDEMRNMIRTGYTPLTREFIAGVQLLTAEDAALQQVSKYKPRSCFVWAKPNAVEYQIEGEDRKVAKLIADKTAGS